MTTHLIVVTETREFVYEVEVLQPTTLGSTVAQDFAMIVHESADEWVEDTDVKVSLHRAHPIKRRVHWVSSRRGSL